MNDNQVRDIQTAKLVEQVIKARRSVRRFQDRKIEQDLVEMILTSAIHAPSGSNWQNQRFLVIEDPAEINRIGAARFVWPYRNADPDKIKKTNPAGIIGHCKLLVLVFVDALENDRRGNGEYYLWESLEIQNCSASIQNMLIQATALGIASCWISASDGMSYTRLVSGQSWRQILSKYDIPETYKIQGIVAFGYPLKTDAEGFPIGEARHGATVWQSTDRKPLEEYLIGLKRPDHPQVVGRQRLTVRFYSSCIRFLLRIVRRLDIAIHRTEIGK